VKFRKHLENTVPEVKGNKTIYHEFWRVTM
jgi:hypothetical protein